MNLLFLKGFNNYFNRKIKKYSDLQDYKDKSDSYYEFENINFNPNDGIATVQIVGSENQKQSGGSEPTPLDWENDGSPDYVIAYETSIIENPGEEPATIITIKSRWFVVESVRERLGQYKLALKRDVIADHLKEILKAPCYVEKGLVSDYTYKNLHRIPGTGTATSDDKETLNPLLFNSENMGVSEIKVGELYLKDPTNIPWIVMYVSKNSPNADTTANAEMVIDATDILDPSELPWNMTSTNDQTVKAAGQLVIKETIALENTNDRYFYYPYKSTLCFNSGNAGTDTQWIFNQYTSRTEYIGSGTNNKYLTRGAYNLSPSSTVIGTHNYADTDIPVSYYYEEPGSNLFDEPQDWREVAPQIHNMFRYSYNRGEYPTTLNYLKNRLSYSASVIKTANGDQSFKAASTITSFHNKFVEYNGLYYQIKIEHEGTKYDNLNHYIVSGGKLVLNTDVSTYNPSEPQQLTAFDEYLYNSAANSNYVRPQPEKQHAEYAFYYQQYKIKYTRVFTETLTMALNRAGNRRSNMDGVFDVLIFPYGEIQCKTTDDGTFTSNAQVSLAMAQAIAAKLDSACYDIQMLPYCPIQGLRESEQPYDLTTGAALRNVLTYNRITDSNGNVRSIAFWSPSSSGSFDIELSGRDNTILGCLSGFPDSALYNNDNYFTLSDIKGRRDIICLKAFTDLFKTRLVSPNYSGIYEFNLAKNVPMDDPNDPNIAHPYNFWIARLSYIGFPKEYYNVDFNYKPYNPYIHVAPVYNDTSFYGKDFNDGRGLIVSGDLSISHITDAWAQYQVQNANYEAIFNRQIQNLDFNNKIAKEQLEYTDLPEMIINWTGLGQAGISGFSAGMSSGGWVAGMVGGIAGTLTSGITSTIGYNKDKEWLNAQQQEARKYMIDMYKMQLGNVKALPYSLAKVDALNENFKFFPFIEVYTCTKREGDIYIKKLMYDGMTINAIGTLDDYSTPIDDPNDEGRDFRQDFKYIRLKGKLITLDGLIDDSHIANEIYSEVDKGFYLMDGIKDNEEE